MRLLSALPLIIMLLVPASGSSQSRIPDASSCPQCGVTIRDLVRLDDSPHAPMPGWPFSVQQDRLGRYWLVYLNDLPLIYNSDTSLLRELGPSGDGPNEYRYPNAVVPLPGDSVLVWDRGRSALYVLAPDTRQARTIEYPRGSGSISLRVIRWPNSVLIHTLSAPSDPRDPFSLYDLGSASPRLLHAFGAGLAPASQRPVLPHLYRSFIESDANQLWTWTPLEGGYRLERWSPAGVRLSFSDRHPAWWPVLGDRTPVVRDGIRSAFQDSTGLIWVFLDEPTEMGQAAVRSPPGSSLNFLLSNDPSRAANEKLYRTVVEVIDPATESVVARETLDAWVFTTLEGRRAAIYGTTPAETPFVRIVTFELTRP